MKTCKILVAISLSITAAILVSALVVIGASAYGTALLSDYYGSDYYYGSDADMNGDGSTDVRDLVCLKKVLSLS